MTFLPALLLVLAQAPLRARTADRPSVLIILTDDAGWSERPLMPQLDGLAKRGVTFTRAYAMPVCATTRLALMFGHYPRRDGIGWTELDPQMTTAERLPLELLSLAELFKPTHRTALAGKWHLGRAPLDNGSTAGLTVAQLTVAQHALGPYTQGWDAWPAGNLAALGPGGYYSWRKVVDGNALIETRYSTLAQREEFQAWWQATSGPKLGWLSFNAPHVSAVGWEPPPGYADMGSPRANYEQMVEYLGAQIATLLTSVDLATTYVVVTCDNGTHDAVRPLGTVSGIWKGTTFEGGVRVPLIVAGPGIAQGLQTERLVSLMDLGATLAEATGTPIGRGFEDSVSFADALGPWKGEAARGFVFVEGYRKASNGTGPIEYDDQAVIEAGWKLRRVDPDGEGAEPSADHHYFISAPGIEVPLVPSQAIQERLLAELASLPPRTP